MDLYETLGVKKNASRDTIQKAFRKKAKKTHPDRGGTSQEFMAVALAYRILSDDGARERYDRTGSTDTTPREQAINTAAVERFCQLFVRCIEQSGGREDIDFLKEIRNAGNTSKDSIKQEQRNLNKKLKELKSIRDRLTYKGKKQDVLSNVLADRERQLRGAIERLKEEMEITNRMMSVADEYEFRIMESPKEYEFVQSGGPMFIRFTTR